MKDLTGEIEKNRIYTVKECASIKSCSEQYIREVIYNKKLKASRNPKNYPQIWDILGSDFIDFVTVKPKPIVTHKTCTSCGENKPLRHFTKRHYKKGIYPNSWCKGCYRKHRRTPEMKRKNREYVKKAQYWKRSENRIKHKARIKLQYHVRKGKIKRQPCKICGDRKVHGHHDDYNKPLEVRWLCPYHHHEHHEIERQKKRKEKLNRVRQ